MVRSSMLMKAKKVVAIVGQENPAISHRERRDLGIRHGGMRLSGIQRGDDVMSQPPQFRDHLHRDILVRIETGRFLCGLVFANLRLDFFGMRARVGPGVHQIFGTQVRVGNQQGLLAGAQAAGLLEKPNGDPGSNDTRLTAAHIRPRVDTGKIVIKVPNHPLEDLRLLPTRQSRQHFLKIAQALHGIPLFIVADARRPGDGGFPVGPRGSVWLTPESMVGYGRGIV